jgi:hypothetical protein
VNPRVKRLTGQAQMMACDGEVKSQACRAGANIDGRKDVLNSVADIEDLVRLGTMKAVRNLHRFTTLMANAPVLSVCSCVQVPN